MRRLIENPDDAEAAEVLSREPEYVGIIRTTWVATMLRAGHAENALPQSATVTVNCRIFPGVEVAEVRAKLIEVVGNDSVEIELLGDPISSPPSPLRDDVLAAVAAAVDSRFPDTSVVPYMAAGATDGVVTRAAGIPTYGVSGLFIDPNEDFSHGLNERVLVESFFGGLDHWHTLLTTLAGPPREENMP